MFMKKKLRCRRAHAVYIQSATNARPPSDSTTGSNQKEGVQGPCLHKYWRCLQCKWRGDSDNHLMKMSWYPLMCGVGVGEDTVLSRSALPSRV